MPKPADEFENMIWPEGLPSVEIPENLRPSQQRLRNLSNTILKHEPNTEAFSDLPEGLDLTKFEHMAAPPMYDETLAPAVVLKTPDKRVVWLTIFRNPDTNQIVRQNIMVVDPESNRLERDEIPEENYDIVEAPENGLVITYTDGPRMTDAEVATLQKLIDASKRFNPFFDAE